MLNSFQAFDSGGGGSAHVWIGILAEFLEDGRVFVPRPASFMVAAIR